MSQAAVRSAIRTSAPAPAGDVCVIFNPTAGRRRLADHLERFRRVFGPHFAPLPTQHAGHAEELAYEAARAGYSVVTAAGGDGTVHEVANGLLRAGRPDVVLRVLPAGSANDYAYSLGLDADARRQPLTVRRVDVGRARRTDGQERYFINGLGLGLNGAVTREARTIRHVRGIPLYTLAVLRAVCYQFRAPVMTVELDGQTRTTPTLLMSIQLGQREGNFVVAPDAKLDDGCFDYLQAGGLQRWEVLRCLPNVITTGRLPEHAQIWTGRCRQVKVTSTEALTIHLDGELFSLPQDRLNGVDVELLPGALAVLGK